MNFQRGKLKEIIGLCLLLLVSILTWQLWLWWVGLAIFIATIVLRGLSWLYNKASEILTAMALDEQYPEP